MKKVYKLDNKYFNVNYIRNMSELKIVNEYEKVEHEKKIDEEVDERCLHFLDKCTKIPPVHIYPCYSKDCRTIYITVDDKEYQCCNYETENAGFTFTANTTTEKLEKFDKFKSEAIDLLEAFRSL